MAERRDALKIIGSIGATCAFPFAADELYAQHEGTHNVEAKLPGCGGRSYRDEEVHLWTFNADGKVARLRHYLDTAKHIQAFRG